MEKFRLEGIEEPSIFPDYRSYLLFEESDELHMEEAVGKLELFILRPSAKFIEMGQKHRLHIFVESYYEQEPADFLTELADFVEREFKDLTSQWESEIKNIRRGIYATTIEY